MSKYAKPLVPLEKIEQLVQVEPAVLTLGLALGAWIAYKIFLRSVSEERHRTLKTLFRNLTFHLCFGTSLFLFYQLLQQIPSPEPALDRFTTYIGLGTILAGATVFVKVWRILVFEYLYLSHMRVAFPLLLVNLFTLLLSLVLGTWIGTEIFNIQLAPILATSAIFSLVLGLALQDTLGNLFAGVALQFDKPYELGDWVEVSSGGQTWVGQVYEITWRATVLISFTEESLTIPNRLMGQSQISNFSTKYRPIIRSQVIRLPFHCDPTETKELLLNAIRSISEIRKNPAPAVRIIDTNECGVGFRLVYYIDNFGDQFIIADRVLSKCVTQLKDAGYEFASHRITVNTVGVKEAAFE